MLSVLQSYRFNYRKHEKETILENTLNDVNNRLPNNALLNVLH